LSQSYARDILYVVYVCGTRNELSITKDIGYAGRAQISASLSSFRDDMPGLAAWTGTMGVSHTTGKGTDGTEPGVGVWEAVD